jgi:hypothetical protein
MKKLFFIAFLIIILIGGLYYSYDYLILQGGPTKRTLTVNGCTLTYTHFITDNQYQMNKTGGHVFNNIMELGAAKIEIGKCLCDSYLKKKTNADSLELTKILNSEEYTYAKNLFWLNIEDFSTDTIRIERVCKEKEKYFGLMIMD